MSEHECTEECLVEALEKPLDPSAVIKGRVVYLAVQGMGCVRCAIRVRNGLLNLEGVLEAHVSPDDGLAAAAYNPERTNPFDLVEAVTAAGDDGMHVYRAQLMA